MNECLIVPLCSYFQTIIFIVFFPPADKIIEAHRSIRHSTLQQIWWLHCSLANATEIINSVYAIQLLFWISSMSFNLMSRIYSLKVFKLSDYGKIRESMLVTDCAWNLVLITTVCHMTAHQVDLSLNQTEISPISRRTYGDITLLFVQANRVGELIFSPYSSVSLKRVHLQVSSSLIISH